MWELARIVQRGFGAFWIVRNHVGKALLDSRRSFTSVKSKLKAELMVFEWVVVSLGDTHHTNMITKPIFFISERSFGDSIKVILL